MSFGVPRPHDVIQLEVTVLEVGCDNTLALVELSDENGETLATFTIPTGYGNIVYRAPEAEAQ